MLVHPFPYFYYNILYFLFPMKRIRCPKCDEAILFDETQYEAGRILVFECPECHKQFKLRIPQRKKTEDADNDPGKKPLGYLIVLENAFQFKQEIPLYEGKNIIGRLVKGTQANAAFKTVDPSIDTTHCIVNVNKRSDGTAHFVICDAPSNTGTFVQNAILSDRDRVVLHEGDIINIGAATILLRTADETQEK